MTREEWQQRTFVSLEAKPSMLTELLTTWNDEQKEAAYEAYLYRNKLPPRSLMQAIPASRQIQITRQRIEAQRTQPQTGVSGRAEEKPKLPFKLPVASLPSVKPEEPATILSPDLKEMVSQDLDAEAERLVEAVRIEDFDLFSSETNFPQDIFEMISLPATYSSQVGWNLPNSWYGRALGENKGNPIAQMLFHQAYNIERKNQQKERKDKLKELPQGPIQGVQWLLQNKKKYSEASERIKAGQGTTEDNAFVQQWDTDWNEAMQMGRSTSMWVIIAALTGLGINAETQYQNTVSQHNEIIAKGISQSEEIAGAYQAAEAGTATPAQVQLINDWESVVQLEPGTYVPGTEPLSEAAERVPGRMLGVPTTQPKAGEVITDAEYADKMKQFDDEVAELYKNPIPQGEARWKELLTQRQEELDVIRSRAASGDPVAQEWLPRMEAHYKSLLESGYSPPPTVGEVVKGTGVSDPISTGRAWNNYALKQIQKGRPMPLVTDNPEALKGIYQETPQAEMINRLMPKGSETTLNTPINQAALQRFAFETQTPYTQVIDELPTVAMARQVLDLYPNISGVAEEVPTLPLLVQHGTFNMVSAFNQSLMANAIFGVPVAEAAATALEATKEITPTVSEERLLARVINSPQGENVRVIEVDVEDLGALNSRLGESGVNQEIIQPVRTKLGEQFGVNQVYRPYAAQHAVIVPADMSDKEIAQKVKDVEKAIGRGVKLKHLDITDQFPTIIQRTKGGKYAVREGRTGLLRPATKEDRFRDRGLEGDETRDIERGRVPVIGIGDRRGYRAISDAERKGYRPQAQVSPEVILPQQPEVDETIPLRGIVEFKEYRLGDRDNPQAFEVTPVEKNYTALRELEDDEHLIIRADLNNFGNVIRQFPVETRWTEGNAQVMVPIANAAVALFGEWVSMPGGDELHFTQPEGWTREQFEARYNEFADFVEGIRVGNQQIGITGILAKHSDFAESKLIEAKPKEKEFVPGVEEYVPYEQWAEGETHALPKNPEVRNAILNEIKTNKRGSKVDVLIAVKNKSTGQIFTASRVGEMHVNVMEDNNIPLDDAESGFMYRLKGQRGTRLIDQIAEDDVWYEENRPKEIALENIAKRLRGKNREMVQRAEASQDPKTKLSIMREVRANTTSEVAQKDIDDWIVANGGDIGDGGDIFDEFHNKYIGEPEEIKINMRERLREGTHRLYTEMVDWKHPMHRGVADGLRAWNVVYKTVRNQARLENSKAKTAAKAAMASGRYSKALREARALFMLKQEKWTPVRAARFAGVEYKNPQQLEADLKSRVAAYPKEIVDVVQAENRATTLEELNDQIRQQAEFTDVFTRRILGIPGIVIATLEGGPVHVTERGMIEYRGEPLKDIVRPVYKAKLGKILESYLTARRNLEFDGNGIPMPKEVVRDSKRIVSETEKSEHRDLIKGTAYRITQFLRDVLKEGVDVGLISQAQYDAMIAKNQTYVPFARIFEATWGEKGKKLGIEGKEPLGFVDVGWDITSGTQATPDYLKRVVGTKKITKIENPIMEIIPYVGRMVQLIERQRAFQSLQGMYKNIREAMGIYLTGEASKKAKNAIQAMDQEMKEVKEGYTLSEEESTKGYQVVKMQDEGETKYYRVHPELYKTITRLGGKELTGAWNILIRPLEVVARLKRLGITGLSPEFALLTNPIRDMVMQAIINPEVVIPFTTLPIGLFHMAKGFIDGQKMYFKYLASGAGISTMMEALNLPQKGPKELFEKTTGTKPAKRIAKEYLNPKQLAENILNVTEIASRLGLFVWEKEVFKKPDVVAAERARRGSIDFAQHGRSGLSEAMRRTTAYFNPNVQGLAEVGAAFKKRPLTTLAKLAFVIVPSVIFTTLLLQDKRKKKIYDEMPEGDKKNYWNHLIEISKDQAEALYGKGYIRAHEADGHYYVILRYAKPLELGMFGTLTEKSILWGQDQDPRIASELGKLFWKDIVPPLVPSAIQTLFEIRANRSSYTERPIVPEYLKELPPEEQYNVYTPQTYVALGQALGISPLQIEHWIYGTTGTMGALAVEGAIDPILNMLDVGPERAPRPAKMLVQKPGIRKFVKSEKVGYSTATATEYGKLVYEKINPEYRNLSNVILSNWTRSNLNAHLDQITDNVIAYPLVNETQNVLGGINQARKLIGNAYGIDAENKRDFLYEINYLTSGIIDEAMDKYKEFKADIVEMSDEDKVNYMMRFKDIGTPEQREIVRRSSPYLYGSYEGTKLNRRGVVQVMGQAIEILQAQRNQAETQGNINLVQRIDNEIHQAREVLKTIRGLRGL